MPSAWEQQRLGLAFCRDEGGRKREKRKMGEEEEEEGDEKEERVELEVVSVVGEE